METSCFLYRSQTALDARSPEIQMILIAARSRNADMGLSGYLHYEDGHFYQWLEGPEDALAQVGALIESDPLHEDLTYLWRGTQEQRQFSGWEMGFGSSASGTLFEWVADRDIHVGDRLSFGRGLLAFMLSVLGYRPAA